MKSIFFRILAWIAALIMLQTLYFKFTGHPESVYIFTVLGIEPYGRIGSGIMELIASILLIIPRTTLYGAVLGAMVMLGAVFSHLFFLGIEVKGDGGQLFIMAIIVLLCCLVIVVQQKDSLLAKIRSFK